MSVEDLFRLDGRVAVVTGGAGLLGAQFCRTLAEAGAAVVIADLNEQAARSIEQALSEDGLIVRAVAVDVTSAASVHEMVQTTLKLFARLDILVNSAALDPKFDPQHGGHEQGFEHYPLEAWNQALAVNLTGAFLCCQAVIPPMLEQGRGVIVNLASIYALTAPDQRLYQRPGKAVQYKPAYYPVTKAGVLALTAYLAAYYGEKNIRVNALSPGGVYNGHDEDFVRAYSARTMLGRMARKEDLNGALLFLASDASAYMTGANLVVDGGWSAW
ncbi:MAG: 3-oxoacyl-[acyl-carrier protein] reductase [Anaerolineae bacterium]|jgi:2-deoxy-D-gluconate 3-dehydrogenase|nr:MAG: 3-oxoacyl-[acyl-carrier protein] reductase [Anaerolineae bacterium]